MFLDYDLKNLLGKFEEHKEYMDASVERGIEENRKGYMGLRFVDKDGNEVKDVHVEATLKRHDFKFGGAIFLLDEFDSEFKNEEYRKLFKQVFNYATVPVYWNTLEPGKGHYRFDKNSEKIFRRPALDLIMEYCRENDMRMKAHCLMYHSFNPEWMPSENRDIKIEVEKRLAVLSEKYGKYFDDVDVINEMTFAYKNRYEGIRTFPIVDEADHEKWCFDIAKKYFPHSKLYWNEGTDASFLRTLYYGDKSVPYLMIQNGILQKMPIEGIGMQFHTIGDWMKDINDAHFFYNPVAIAEVLDRYSDFGLPIHLSEISVPAWENSPEAEYVQGEVVKNMYRIWFSRKNVDAIIYWNLADGMAYPGSGPGCDDDENRWRAGIIREDMSKKPAYDAIDDLINNQWRTSICTKCDDYGRVKYNGFYGQYEIKTVYKGVEKNTKLNLNKLNTGYDGVSKDLRYHTIVVD